MFWFTLIIFIGSLGWLFSSPDWEPALFSVSSLAALLAQEPHGKSLIKRLISKIKSKKITIKGRGNITNSDEELLDIIRRKSPGQVSEAIIIDMSANELKKYAERKAKDDNEKYYLLAQAKRMNEKLPLVAAGLDTLAEKYSKGFFRVGVDSLPGIFREYVNLIYPPLPIDNRFIPYNKSTNFDIYSNNINGKELSFIASFPEEVCRQLLDKFEAKSLQHFTIPYNHSAIELPETAIYKHVVPALILAGQTKYKELGRNDNFWALHNWAFGLH
ncbi:hypothetical protein P9K38_17295 [Pseudomonas sp. 905_Psudmo1]|nr:hypothetical protein [Pseudomonas sp. 905_Psudmo1]WFS17198.1 hypothetical protein P9K38_17295 [Pseudomonas sp. 905_Psudmo1]